jgi:hypothetical protein
LIVALVVCLVLVVAGCGVTGVLLYRLYRSEHHDPQWPAGWPTARFAMSGDARTRDEAGQLLVLMSGTDTRYVVRPYGVELAARPGQRAVLDRLTGALPLRTALALVPVLSTTRTSGPCVPSGGDGRACDPATGETFAVGTVLLRGDGIADARVTDGPGSSWAVTVRFTSAGQRAFTAATQRYGGQRLAFVVAGIVLIAPQVTGPLPGEMQLAGSFHANEARHLAAALRAGRRPVTVSRH